MDRHPSSSPIVFAGWHKSTRSGNQADCVEVAASTDGAVVGVRDSKHPDGGTLVFSPGSWRAFVTAVKAGEFDQG